LINGLFAESKPIIVGDSAQEDPSFSNILFCVESGDELCYGDVYVLPTGNTIRASFIHRNIPPGMPWAARWLYNDVEIPGSRTEGEWVPEQRSVTITRLSAADILPPGRYRLELYISDALAAT